MEIWKPIKDFEGFYEISNKGQVKSLERKVEGKLNSVRIVKEKLITSTDNGKGYMVVTLYKDKKRFFKKVHRLVAEAFISNPENKPEVNHIDGNKENNNVENLEWATTKENCVHRQNNGLGNIVNANNARKIRIAKVDLDTGKVLKEYESAIEASKELQCRPDAIRRVARGERKSYSGYGWKFLD